MPAIEHRFKVKAQPDAIEALLSDFNKVYYLFPSFASAEKVAEGHHWFLKSSVELEAGTPFLTARILKQEPGMIEWEAVSPTLVWHGAFTWTGLNDHVEITLRLEIKDVGLGGSMHEALLSVELPELARFFQTRTREILESKPWLNGLP
jgi:hypothetical protein